MSEVNDIRIATAYKKQFKDQFKLTEDDFLIDPKTKWVEFECEFKINNIKFHPHIRYENKNANTPRIMDIRLYKDSGPFKNLGYSSQYVESSKVSEVSIHNIIEMCKSMWYEMSAVEQNIDEWLKDPNKKRYDLPVLPQKEFYEIGCRSGLIDSNGFTNDVMKFDSDEFKAMYDDHKRLVELFNTFPYILQDGRYDDVSYGSYGLKHLLERIDQHRKGSGYFSNGVTIATMPRALNDRFHSTVRTKNESVPNCDIVIPKQLYYFIDCLNNMVAR